MPLDILSNDEAPDLAPLVKSETKILAFYLPQFHRVRENDEWWGPGFTEWTNVAKGKPNFDGHYQPHIPRELGFYNLADTATLTQQVELAKAYGVTGFSFYYYWFDGRRILNTPIDNFLKSDIDFPFCFTWANENWTRTWDGKERDILLSQTYEPEFALKLMRDLAPALKDKRYIKFNDEPMFIIYRAMSIPNVKESIRELRAAAVSEGIGPIHISAVDFYDIDDPKSIGADSLVEFPPHKFNGPQNVYEPKLENLNPEFSGALVDYDKMILQSLSRKEQDFTLHRGIIPSWDNTARRQTSPTIVIGASAKKFGIWLRALRRASTLKFGTHQSPFIFVNAWNEWAEGAHLEPDLKNGLEYLEELAKSQWNEADDSMENILEDVKSKLISLATTSDVRRGLSDYKPISPFVQSLSRRLLKYPKVHAFAAAVYVMAKGRR